MKLIRLSVVTISAVLFAGCSDDVEHENETRIIGSEEYFGDTITNFYYADPDAEFKMRLDAIELAPEHSEVFAAIDDEVEEELKDHPRGLGFVHLFWATKERILKEKYGISWRSPGELNPNILFD